MLDEFTDIMIAANRVERALVDLIEDTNGCGRRIPLGQRLKPPPEVRRCLRCEGRIAGQFADGFEGRRNIREATRLNDFDTVAPFREFADDMLRRSALPGEQHIRLE